MTDIPDHLIPDGLVRLGDQGTCIVEECEREIRGFSIPSYCRPHFFEEFFDGDAGECPDCDGQLLRWDGDVGEQTACVDCHDGLDDLEPKTSRRGGI